MVILLSRKHVQRLPFDYAWVILAILFLGLLATFGARASFGAYITSWEQDFSVDRTVVTSISMLSFIVYAFAQPFEPGNLCEDLIQSTLSFITEDKIEKGLSRSARILGGANDIQLTFHT